MDKVATTKMTSKGQVVIPESIRKQLGLEPGSRFVVLGEGDVVIFKVLEAPSLDQFDEMITEARRQARRAGLKKVHVAEAIRSVRNGR